MLLEKTHFSTLLKTWRAKEHLSQLDLALLCNVSQKHISFIESERAKPSQGLVLRIGEALHLPLRQRNDLLLAAGFAPVFTEADLTSPDLECVDQAVSLILDHHDPLPALVIDGGFQIIRSNPAALKFLMLLYGVQTAEGLPDFSCNLLRGMFHDDGIWPRIANWHLIGPFLVHQLEGRLLQASRPPQLVALHKELENYRAFQRATEMPISFPTKIPVVTTDFLLESGEVLSLFSTITKLGLTFDVVLEEMRVECFFPANDTTRTFFFEQ